MLRARQHRRVRGAVWIGGPRRATCSVDRPTVGPVSGWRDVFGDLLRRVTRTPSTSPPAGPVGGSARIEYSPSLDGDPDPGEIVWTWVPFEDDPTQGKDRPVVVIGRRGDTLLAVGLTSKRKSQEIQVGVGSGSWDHEGRESYANVDRLLDVDPVGVRREGAVLDRGRFDAVVAAVERIHHIDDGRGK